MEKNDKTVYKVSKETKIAQSTFSDWKNGRSKPKFDKLMVLARYFNVPVEYFAEEDDKERTYAKVKTKRRRNKKQDA